MIDDLTREHERALLACALLGDAHAARNLLGMVQAPMFADPKLARAWSALRRVLALEAAAAPTRTLLNSVATPTGQAALICTKSPAPPTPPTTRCA